nr:translation initiation factor IF-2 [Oryctolagus cuniculus]
MGSPSRSRGRECGLAFPVDGSAKTGNTFLPECFVPSQPPSGLQQGGNNLLVPVRVDPSPGLRHSLSVLRKVGAGGEGQASPTDFGTNGDALRELPAGNKRTFSRRRFSNSGLTVERTGAGSPRAGGVSASRTRGLQGRVRGATPAGPAPSGRRPRVGKGLPRGRGRTARGAPQPGGGAGKRAAPAQEPRPARGQRPHPGVSVPAPWGPGPAGGGGARGRRWEARRTVGSGGQAWAKAAGLRLALESRRRSRPGRLRLSLAAALPALRPGL